MMTQIDTVYHDNSCYAKQGGAIAIRGQGDIIVILTTCYFTRNIATSGGAIAARGSSSQVVLVELHQTTIHNNTVAFSGGIDIMGEVQLIMDTCSVTYNNASQRIDYNGLAMCHVRNCM
jgi:predicted outer membrane repeat protein